MKSLLKHPAALFLSLALSLIIIGITLLLFRMEFGLRFLASGAAAGVISFIFSLRRSKNALQRLDNGLYQNPHSPEGAIYLYHPIRESTTPTEMAIDYLVSLFVHYGGWHGIPASQIRADFPLDTSNGLKAFGQIAEGLQLLVEQNWIEEVTVPDPDHRDRLMTVYCVSRNFNSLLQSQK